MRADAKLFFPWQRAKHTPNVPTFDKGQRNSQTAQRDEEIARGQKRSWIKKNINFD